MSPNLKIKPCAHNYVCIIDFVNTAGCLFTLDAQKKFSYVVPKYCHLHHDMVSYKPQNLANKLIRHFLVDVFNVLKEDSIIAIIKHINLTH